MPRPRPPASIASRQEEEEEEEEDGDGMDSQSDSGPDEDPLETLFCPDGHPCRFFLHKSMTDEMKTKAIKKIVAHGGQTTTHERKAHVILVFETRLHMDLAIMQLHYNANEDRVLQSIYVEPHTFLKKCIDTVYFKLGKDKRPKMGMPGPRPRGQGEHTRRRVEYTDDDDHHLCYYLARRTPDPNEGGRMGNAIYKELERLGRSNKRHWSCRHPWQSWRNRYSKNKEVMDERIAEYVARIGRNGKGEYPRARKAPRSHRARASKRKSQMSDSNDASESHSIELESEEEDELQDEVQEGELRDDDEHENQNYDDNEQEVQELRQEEESAPVPSTLPVLKKRIRPDRAGIQYVKEGEANENGGEGGKRMKMALDAVEIPVVAHKLKANKGAVVSDIDAASGGKGKGKQKAKEKKRFKARSPNLDDEEDMQFDIENGDANMFDPLSNLNDQGPSNTPLSPFPRPSPAVPRASSQLRNQLRAQAYSGNSQGAIMTSSQATLVSTQARAQPAPRLTRGQARGAEARAQASPPNVSGSGAMRRTAATRILNVSPASVEQVTAPRPEAPRPSRNTRARSRSMEPASVTKTKKDAGKDKGRGPVVLGPLIENEDTMQDEGDQGNQSRSIDRSRHIRQLSPSLSQTGPMVGETNDEEEVDQLLDGDSGTADLDERDEEEQESEDDAQIRGVLENPGGRYKVAEDEDEDSEGNEDESESEDDLTKLQKAARELKANLRPNPTPNAWTKTSRRYIPLSQR